MSGSPGSGSPPPGPFAVLRGHFTPVRTLCFFSTTGDRLLSGGGDAGFRIWDLNVRRVQFAYRTSEETALQFLPLSDTAFYVQCKGGQVYLVDSTSETCDCILRTDYLGFCRAVLYQPDEFTAQLALPDADRAHLINVWDMQHRRVVLVLKAPLSPPSGMCLALSLDAQQHALFAAFEDGCVRSYHLRATPRAPDPPAALSPAVPPAERGVAHPQLDAAFTSARLSDDPLMCIDARAGYVVTAGASAVVSVMQTDPARPGHMGDVHRIELPMAGVSAVVIRADGRLVGCAGEDFRVRLFALPSCNPLCVLRHHTGPVRALVFRQDGVFASGGEDAHIALWNVYAADPSAAAGARAGASPFSV